MPGSRRSSFSPLDGPNLPYFSDINLNPDPGANARRSRTRPGLRSTRPPSPQSVNPDYPGRAISPTTFPTQFSPGYARKGGPPKPVFINESPLFRTPPTDTYEDSGLGPPRRRTDPLVGSQCSDFSPNRRRRKSVAGDLSRPPSSLGQQQGLPGASFGYPYPESLHPFPDFTDSTPPPASFSAQTPPMSFFMPSSKKPVSRKHSPQPSFASNHEGSLLGTSRPPSVLSAGLGNPVLSPSGRARQSLSGNSTLGMQTPRARLHSGNPSPSPSRAATPVPCPSSQGKSSRSGMQLQVNGVKVGPFEVGNIGHELGIAEFHTQAEMRVDPRRYWKDLIKEVLIYVGKEGAFEPFTRAIAMCKFVEGHSQKYYRSNLMHKDSGKIVKYIPRHFVIPADFRWAKYDPTSDHDYNYDKLSARGVGKDNSYKNLFNQMCSMTKSDLLYNLQPESLVKKIGLIH